MPVIPEKGSVGASGDLAPLGHMALALIGEGEVFFKGNREKTITALKKARVKPLSFETKRRDKSYKWDSSFYRYCNQNIIRWTSTINFCRHSWCSSVENSFSSHKVFQKIHDLKQHPGQKISARNIYKLLRKSEIVRSHSNCSKVQDPYSRCIPHVHGASRDIFSNAANIINNEINSVSDNPLILDSKTIVSSGHFHAEHVAMALDSLAFSFF